MSRLDDYRTALLVAHPDVAVERLVAALDERPAEFPRFVVDMGLGPLWHERTRRAEFYEARVQAEALYLAQERSLDEIGAVLDRAGIEHVVIKGAATRLLLYDNPAARASFDIDLLVQSADRVEAAEKISRLGFEPSPEARSISRELVLARGGTDVDLHWGLLREGRLRTDPTAGILARRRRVGSAWVPSSNDMLFILLVHPAFAKHLGGWAMGLHRVADVLAFLRTQDFDIPSVVSLVRDNGVSAAAWATLRWTQLLAEPKVPTKLPGLLAELDPPRLKRGWLDGWLRNDLSDRLAAFHGTRLLAFSWLLHDTPADALRAFQGRRRAVRRSGEDLAAFRGLLGE
jgi:hypothetical protein